MWLSKYELEPFLERNQDQHTELVYFYPRLNLYYVGWPEDQPDYDRSEPCVVCGCLADMYVRPDAFDRGASF